MICTCNDYLQYLVKEHNRQMKVQPIEQVYKCTSVLVYKYTSIQM